MSASGRVYAAACELVDSGYSVKQVINILVKDYGLTRDYAGAIVDAIVKEHW